MHHGNIDEKWQKRWEEAGIFDAEVDVNKEKFFVNFPYPYMNGYFHIGHAFSLMRTEVFARYKRMRGYNILFPFAFHCTGTPIVAAAQRIAENEPKQIEILEQMDIPKEEISKFADPLYWVSFFPDETMHDLKRMGTSIDWRRRFITTSANPYYDAFIKWQFNKLKKSGYITKGEHPVVWCSKCKSPVGDHARLKGEGVSPEEVFLIKFYMGGVVLPTATYRPETSFGVTNIWIKPDADYVETRVDDEVWIVSRETVEKMGAQKHAVKVIRSLKGKELIGKYSTNAVTGEKVPVLPAHFIEPATGTGIVMSVPSHAPYDYAALKDIRDDPKKHGVTPDLIRNIEPVSLIEVQDFGAHPAIEIVEKMGIRGQDDPKLEMATKDVYRKEFHTGVLNEKTGKYAGLKVSEVKEILVKDFVRENKAILLYELSEEVICRCLTRCIVKIVSDQWFLNYSNAKWKRKVHEAMDGVTFYPEKVRGQFEYVIDWLKDWACTREFGLGTRLPWDERWVIESLSDSTIYMAYYTIAHYLEGENPLIKAENLTDDFFDYIFLGKGDVEEVVREAEVSPALLQRMRTEFEYWYPFDFRNSGKDLIQNHLTFCLYNHVAIFPKKYWSLGIGVNGFIKIDGEKMSKSKGNFYTSRQIYTVYGADATRITLMYGEEGLDDPNWDTEFAKSIGSKLKLWHDFAIENHGHGGSSIEHVENQRVTTLADIGLRHIDRWFQSILHKTIKATTEAMDRTEFRTALQKGYFDLQRHLKWYTRRTREYNRDLMNQFIEVQTKMIAPFVPHICEEIWEKLGKKDFISLTEWPQYDETLIDEKIERAEEFIKDVIADVQEIFAVARIKEAKTAHIYTAEDWKWEVMELVAGKDMRGAMRDVMQDSELRKRGKEVSAFVQKVTSDRTFVEKIDENGVLQDARDFIEKELGMKLRVNPDYDPQNKRKMAIPGRPAIYIE